MFIVGLIPTRWCNLVPTKLNVFLWRALWDRILSRVNLVDRGANIPTVLCPCSLDVHDKKNVFVNCEVASKIC